MSCDEDITSKYQEKIAQQSGKIQNMGKLLLQLEENIKIHEEKGKMSVEKSETEVKYLKILVKETTDKNEILKENNHLLLERIKLLEQQIHSSIINPPTSDKSVTKPKSGKITNNPTNDLSRHSHINNSEFGDKVEALAPVTSARRNGATDLASQTHDLKVDDIDTNSEGSFELVKTRRQKQHKQGHNLQKKKKNIMYGEREDDMEFSSSSKPKEDAKIWLFLSKIKEHVTEDIVKAHVIKHSQAADNDVQVKQCIPKAQKSNKKCFMVGVKPELKDMVYLPSFWPRGVGFKRFNFSYGRNFLEKKIL